MSSKHNFNEGLEQLSQLGNQRLYKRPKKKKINLMVGSVTALMCLVVLIGIVRTLFLIWTR